MPLKRLTRTLSADCSQSTDAKTLPAFLICIQLDTLFGKRVGIGSDRYDGVASFGRRPMFDVGTVLLEVFLFNFSGDLYGQTIDVAFIDWIRHELKLDTIEELIRRMDEDSRLARIALGRSGDAFPALGEVMG